MAKLRVIFARNLKEKRRKCGFSQAKLAEIVGVSTHHIAMIELTRNFPTVELVERIADALNINVYELFKENDTLSSEFEQLRKDIRIDMQQLLVNFFENDDKCQTQNNGKNKKL